MDAPIPVEEQGVLFDESQLPAGRELLLPEEEQRHRFTGELVARNQRRYQAIVKALGEGLGVRQIARAFSISHHTVESIRERDAQLVATEKQRTGAKLRRLVRMTLDAIEEALVEGKIAPGQLPVTAGILIDKSLNWDGQATAIVAIRHEVNQADVLARFHALAAPILDVECVPDSPASGTLPEAPPIPGSEERVPDFVPALGLPAPTTTQPDPSTDPTGQPTGPAG